MKYVPGDENFKWAELQPGDSVVASQRVVFESATEDKEVPHTSERVLVLAVTREKSHSGLEFVRIYCLSKRGVVYVKRTIGGDPDRTRRYYSP